MAKCWGKRKRNCLLFGKILKKRVVTIYSTYMSVCGVQYRGWAGIYTYIVLDNIPDYSRDNLKERERSGHCLISANYSGEHLGNY